jgi:hypothetical protein
VSNVLKVCDVRVGVLHCPSLCGCRCVFRMKKIHCTYPWLLVVGCYEQSSRLCVQYEGNCATESVMWCVGGVNDLFKKKVLVALPLL